MIKNYKDSKPLQEDLGELVPWYRGFEGDILKLDEKRYVSRGKYNVLNDTTLEITELPVRTWTHKYKEYLESSIVDGTKDSKGKKKEYVRNYTSQCSDSSVYFKVKMNEDDLDDLVHYGTVNDVFKLQSKINLSNMVMYDQNGHLKKYDNVNDILENYFTVKFIIMKRGKNFN